MCRCKGLNRLGQEVVAGFLAGQHQELADGIVDQAALFGFCSGEASR